MAGETARVQAPSGRLLWSYFLKSTGLLHVLRRKHDSCRFARVLLYHHVPDNGAESFDRHLRHLAENYTVLPLRDLLAALKAGSLPRRAVAITFDDGFLSVYENAAPALKRYGFSATLFVTTDFAGIRDKGQARAFCISNFKRRDGLENMTWEQLRELSDWGFEIGSHTGTHPVLSEIRDSSTLGEEILGSRKILEREIGTEVSAFSFPFGSGKDCDARVLSVVREAGYTSCFSGIRGWNDRNTNPYYFFRDPIDPLWPVEVLEMFLSGGGDWWGKIPR
ncbi:MAG: polysaccharide deacetylase family protein [Armatimonadetes bacterium]|nr:polysaccharide deacetylase family protein [Armatimonadota bacterium]